MWWIAILSAVALFAPNTQEIFARYRPALEGPGMTAAPGREWLAPIPRRMRGAAASAALALVLAVYLSLQLSNPAGVTTFIYAFF